MATLLEQLKTKRQTKQQLETPLFGARERVETIVREEMGKFKAEIKQELRTQLKKKLGEKGVTTLKGDRGRSPRVGVDFLTPRDMAQLRREARGRDGLAGGVGRPGSDGRNGRDGIDGISVTKEDLKVLLAPEIEEIKREIIRTRKSSGKGGGGVGDFQHQSFNISAGTTSVQTSSPIAQLGRAIVSISYQGSNLVRTSHYTVGSDFRTITLDTDVQSQLADDTFIDIVYLRG